MDEKRYLILAEEFSQDPHYGKTLRGVMRYRRESVVAILDTKRAGETEDGVPIVARVDDALCFNPDTALVGVVTQGGRFPADSIRPPCTGPSDSLERRERSRRAGASRSWPPP